MTSLDEEVVGGILGEVRSESEDVVVGKDRLCCGKGEEVGRIGEREIEEEGGDEWVCLEVVVGPGGERRSERGAPPPPPVLLVVVVVVCSVVVVVELSLASSRDIPRSHLLADADAGEQRVTVESRLSSTKKIERISPTTTTK